MSSTPRIFVTAPTIQWPNCPLDELSLHHLKDVLRLKKGNRVEVVNQGMLWTVSLIEFQPKSRAMTADLVSSVPIELPSVTIHLIQCLPKVDKISEIIRSCTEMGVARITPAISERCVSLPPNEKAAAKYARWQQVAYSAAAQSRQVRLPIIDPLTDLEAAISGLGDVQKIVFWEDSTTPLKMALQNVSGPLCIIIGPEGGFSEREVQAIKRFGFVDVSMGPTILRVEHAGLVAIAQLTYALL